MGDGRLGAAGDHDVGVVELDGAQASPMALAAEAQAVATAGVRAAQAEVDRDVAGGGVGDHLRDDERADAARAAALHEAGVLLFEFVQPADAAADDDAAAEGVFLGEVQAAVLDGFEGGDHGELGEAVEPPDGLGVEELLRVDSP